MVRILLPSFNYAFHNISTELKNAMIKELPTNMRNAVQKKRILKCLQYITLENVKKNLDSDSLQ